MNNAIEALTICILLITLCAMGIPVWYLSKNDNSNSIFTQRIVVTFFYVVVGLHAVISLLNGFWGPIFGADRDAYVFHLASLDQITTDPPDGWVFGETDFYRVGWYYALFLKSMYTLTTESWAIGCMLSTLAFSYLCIASLNVHLLLKKNLNTMSANIRLKSNSNRYLVYILLSIGLLPTVLLLTSFTLREVFQMLFLITSLSSTLKFVQKKYIFSFFGILISLGLFSTLHHSFMPYSVFYLIGVIIFSQRKVIASWVKKCNKNYFLLALFLTLLIFLIIVNQLFHEVFVTFLRGANINENSRAFYGGTEFSGNVSDILLYVVTSIFNYFIRPFPWEISSWIDIVTIGENLIRIYLWFKLFTYRKNLTQQLIWILCSIALLEIIWALGTLNWGTAQRHHIVVWPLLVVAYFSALEQSRWKNNTSHLRNM